MKSDDAIVRDTKRFLQVDFPDLAYRCGQQKSAIKSPVITDMPAGKPYGNMIEIRAVNLATAMRTFRALEQAFQHMDEPGKTILQLRYIDGLADELIYPQLYIGRTKYFAKTKPAALLEFAKKFDYYATIYQSEMRLTEDDSKEIL